MKKKNSENFSFTHAVMETLALHPQTRKRFLFVDTADNHSDKKAVKHGHWRARLRHLFAYDDKQIQKLIKEANEGNSFAHRHEKEKNKILVLNKSDLVFPLEFQDQEQYFTFDHELAHLLSPYPFKTYEGKGQSFDECIADAYAVIRSIQRYGEDSAIVQMTGWRRAFAALYRKDVEHMTTPVVDQIMEDRKSVDFSQLSARKTMDKAVDYAIAHGATLAQEHRLADMLKHSGLRFAKTADDFRYKLFNLSSSILSISDDYTFKIGVRLFQPFLHPEGIVINKMHIQLNDTKRSVFRMQFEISARKRGLTDVLEMLSDTKDQMFIPQQKKAQNTNRPTPPSFKF